MVKLSWYITLLVPSWMIRPWLGAGETLSFEWECLQRSESSTRFSKDALLYKSIRPSQALHAFRGRFVLATHLDVDCSTCISILPAYQGQVMKVLMKSLVDVSIAQGCHIRS